MTQVIVDDVLLREPNLLTPGCKPVGPVKVGSGSQSADRLTMLFLLSKTGDARNLIDNYTIPRQSGQSLEPVPPGGLASFTTANTRHYLKTTTYNPLDVGTGDLSVLFRIKATNNLTRETVFLIRNEASPYNFIQIRSNAFYVPGAAGSTAEQGTIYFGGFDGANGNARGIKAQSIISGKPQTFIGLRVNNVWKLYGDGVLLGSYDATTNNTDISANTDSFSIGGWSSTDGFEFTGDIYAFAGWKRALSEAEAISLSLDPYQFLIPA